MSQIFHSAASSPNLCVKDSILCSFFLVCQFVIYKTRIQSLCALFIFFAVRETHKTPHSGLTHLKRQRRMSFHFLAHIQRRALTRGGAPVHLQRPPRLLSERVRLQPAPLLAVLFVAFQQVVAVVQGLVLAEAHLLGALYKNRLEAVYGAVIGSLFFWGSMRCNT